MGRPHRIGIVGVGKIARDQHIPALRGNPAFELAACASRNAEVDGVANFPSVEAMLAGFPDLDAIAICTPPQMHYNAARLALKQNKHVFLEKPPCATTHELDLLAQLAKRQGRTLFQSWHSRHGAAVDAARRWLTSRAIRDIRIVWKENVRQWHPGQTWIWRAGGFGVFDPGINALSILTAIVPEAVFMRHAVLFVPENCDSPIASDLALETESGARIEANFDFRETGAQTWDIDIATDDGTIKLADGGGTLFINGARTACPEELGEYPALYQRFSALIASGTSDVDGRPFQLVADAFLIAKRIQVEPFFD